MLYLQAGPAETTSYMVMGFAVIFGVLGIYLASIYLRRRNLEQDYEVLEEWEANDPE